MAIEPLRYSVVLRHTESTRMKPLILEYLSVLLRQITPSIRPVDTLLLTMTEKRQIAHIVDIMAFLSHSYVTLEIMGYRMNLCRTLVFQKWY